MVLLLSVGNALSSSSDYSPLNGVLKGLSPDHSMFDRGDFIAIVGNRNITWRGNVAKYSLSWLNLCGILFLTSVNVSNVLK